MKPKGSTIKRYTCKKDHEHGNKCPATWWARVIYIDPETGKSHDLSRRATSYANSIDKRDQLVAEIEAIPCEIVPRMTIPKQFNHEPSD